MVNCEPFCYILMICQGKNNMMKRILFLLGFGLLLCLYDNSCCYAMGNSDSMEVEVNTIDDLYLGISNQIYNHQVSAAYQIDSYDIFYRLEEIIDNYGYFYYESEPILSGCYLFYYVDNIIYRTIDWRSIKGSKYEVEMTINYLHSKEEMYRYFQDMQNVAEDLKKSSDYKSVKAVHDYIVENVEYDYNHENYLDMEGFQSGKMVCNGYSMATFLLLSYMDIPVRMITGNAREVNGKTVGHAWNIVMLDGNWYNVDATWDDMGQFGYSYDYFLKGMSEFDGHVYDEVLTKRYAGMVSGVSYELPFLDRCLNGKNIISLSEVLVVIIGLLIYLISAIIKRWHKDRDDA